MLSRVLVIDSTCAHAERAGETEKKSERMKEKESERSPGVPIVDGIRIFRRPRPALRCVALCRGARPGGRRRSLVGSRRASRRFSVAPGTKSPGASARQCRARDRGERTRRVSCACPVHNFSLSRAGAREREAATFVSSHCRTRMSITRANRRTRANETRRFFLYDGPTSSSSSRVA